jgi:hypothetical protein
MKQCKYKLIKKYPGSDSVGTIVTGYGKDGWYSKGSGGKTYDWTLVVYNPEFWEEVVEKDYEILKTCPIEGTIYSVKRLSDGEVFTVGDLIKTPYTDCTRITGFNTKYSTEYFIEISTGFTRLLSLEKVKQPIYLTHDGKDIFPKDIVWYVNKENFYHDYIKAYPEVKFNSEIRAYFLTEEEAKKYIIENKPALSIKEFWEITTMSGSNRVKSIVLKELVKKRSNLK